MESQKKTRETAFLKIVASLACLFMFYWFLIQRPIQFTPTPVVSVERSREALEQARGLIRDRKFNQALQLTLKLVNDFPSNPVYLDQLATLYGDLGRYSDEAEALHRYMDLASSPSDACPRLIEAYRKLHQIKEMLASCEKCIAWEPGNSDLLFSLGQAYEWTKDFAHAKQTYEKAMAIAPTNPDPALGMARVSLYDGDPVTARQLASKVLQDNPAAGSDAFLVMGMVLRAEGHFDEAKRYLERGVEKSPQYTDFYLVLGGISEQQENVAAARGYYHQALKSDPGNENAVARLKIIGESP